MYYLKFNVDKLPFIKNDEIAAIAVGPVIFVKNYFKNNKGLVNHEKFHVRMFWVWYILTVLVSTGSAMYLGYIPMNVTENIQLLLENQTFYYIVSLSVIPRTFLYKFVEIYRLWEEVKAYKIQEKTNKQNKLKEFAYYLATYYDIDISEEEALKLLKK